MSLLFQLSIGAAALLWFPFSLAHGGEKTAASRHYNPNQMHKKYLTTEAGSEPVKVLVAPSTNGPNKVKDSIQSIEVKPLTDPFRCGEDDDNFITVKDGCLERASNLVFKTISDPHSTYRAGDARNQCEKWGGRLPMKREIMGLVFKSINELGLYKRYKGKFDYLSMQVGLNGRESIWTYDDEQEWAPGIKRPSTAMTYSLRTFYYKINVKTGDSNYFGIKEDTRTHEIDPLVQEHRRYLESENDVERDFLGFRHPRRYIDVPRKEEVHTDKLLISQTSAEPNELGVALCVREARPGEGTVRIPVTSPKTGNSENSKKQIVNVPPKEPKYKEILKFHHDYRESTDPAPKIIRELIENGKVKVYDYAVAEERWTSEIIQLKRNLNTDCVKVKTTHNDYGGNLPYRAVITISCVERSGPDKMKLILANQCLTHHKNGAIAEWNQFDCKTTVKEASVIPETEFSVEGVTNN